MLKQLEGDVAMLVTGGVYSQADVYLRDTGELFAEVGRGKFVRLYESGATSKSSVRLETLHTDVELTRDPFGRLCVGAGPNRKALDKPPDWLPLPAPTGDGS